MIYSVHKDDGQVWLGDPVMHEEIGITPEEWPRVRDQIDALMKEIWEDEAEKEHWNDRPEGLLCQYELITSRCRRKFFIKVGRECGGRTVKTTSIVELE